MNLFARLLVLGPFAALALAACGSSDDPSSGGSCTAYSVPSSFSATTPTQSFSKDVYPVLYQSCGQFSSCHGAGSGSQAGLNLGSASAAYANLVGVSATTYAMDRVKAGDATSSFLMHRLDGDTCSLAGCSGECTWTMPAAAPPGQGELLASAQRDVIRRWIDQGAQND
jgi:hypothetical protein